MTYQELDLRIKDIYLDNDNPRYEHIDSEPEIIKHMLLEEKVRELAKSIVDMGSTNPIDLMAVVPHPKIKNAYVVAEGNRRLTALKLLDDPELAPTDKEKKYFRDLIDGSEVVISSIRAVVFPDRDSVLPWMYIKHLGAQDGAGTKNWDAAAKIRADRHSGSSDSSGNQSLLLIEYAQENGLVDTSKKIPITTIKRFVSNPIFRDTIGLVDNKSLTIQVPKEQFDRVVSKFLGDSLDKTSDVHSRTYKQDWINYAKSLVKDGMAPDELTKEPYDVYEEQKQTGKGKRPRNAPNPKDRHTVIESKFRLKIDNAITNRLYHELKDINADRFTYSATYLLRAFIDKTVTEYIKIHDSKPAPKQLHKKILKAESLLQSSGLNERETKYLRQMGGNADSDYSPDSIGHAIHGGSVPTVSTLVAIWDSISHLIKEMHEQIRNSGHE